MVGQAVGVLSAQDARYAEILSNHPAEWNDGAAREPIAETTTSP